MVRTLQFVIFIACMILVLATTHPAWATDVPPPNAPPAQEQGQAQLQAQLQAQQQQAEAEAAARANSNATGGEATSYGAFSNDINFHSKMRSLALANPVWTLVPQAGGKCTVSESSAEQVLIVIWSGSRSKQFTDAECAMMQMSNNYRASCQYKTAAMIDRTLYERFNPGKDGGFLTEGTYNLSPIACVALMRPRLILDARKPTVK